MICGTAKVCTGGSVDVLSDCIEQFIAKFGLAVNVLRPFEDQGMIWFRDTMC